MEWVAELACRAGSCGAGGDGKMFHDPDYPSVFKSMIPAAPQDDRHPAD